MKHHIKEHNQIRVHIFTIYALFFVALIIALGGMVAINKVEKSIIKIESSSVYDGAWDEICLDGYTPKQFEGTYAEFSASSNAAIRKYNVTQKVGYFNEVGGFLDFELAKQTLQRQTESAIEKITGEDDAAVMQQLIIRESANLKLFKMESKSKDYVFYEVCNSEPIFRWVKK